MRVDKQSNLPLYQQIKNILEKKIMNNEWEPGYQLPSERELSEIFDVSTITIKRAIHELVDKGYVERQRGRGTFVLNKKEQNISKILTFKNEAWNEDIHPHKIISFKRCKANDQVAKLLGISGDGEIYKIKRIKTEKEQPITIEETFLPYEVFPNLVEHDFEDNLIYNVLVKKFNLKLDKTRIYFSVRKVNEEESRILGLKEGDFLTIIERFTYLSNGRIVEYTIFKLRHDKEKIYFDFKL